MTVDTQLATANELLRMPRGVFRFELVKGELRRMSPAGHTHGRIAARFLMRLAQHVEGNQLGAVYAAETGFLLASSPDTVRAPDVAFVSSEHLNRLSLSPEGFFPGAPDLAVEVISPWDTYSEVESKVVEWLGAGCTLVIVVDPRRGNAVVHRSAAGITILASDQDLRIDDLVPGWSLRVSELFE